MPEKPRILIGSPAYNGIVPEAQPSFAALLFHCGKTLGEQYDFAIEIMTKREQFRARNLLVDSAIATDCTWLLMLDDDMLVPPDLVNRLLAHDKDVCGALYYQRGGSYHPVIMLQAPGPDGTRIPRFIPPMHTIIQEPGLYPVDVIGGGCMLFKVDIFRKLMPPYFWWEHTLGTDLAICGRLSEAGVQVWCDTSVELGHLKQDRQAVTSRTIPLASQALGAVNEQLWRDAVAYLAMPEPELESWMVQASTSEQRQRYWYSQPRDTWEGVRRYYQEQGNWHLANLLYYNLSDYVPQKEWVVTQVRAGQRVIDYGIGLGHLLVPLAEKGTQVVGVEIAGCPTLDFVRWRLTQHALQAQVQLIELETPAPLQDLPTSAHGAYCISVIEHCFSPWAVLHWLARNVTPGGFLVIDYAVGKSEKEPQHLRHYDVQTFAQQMRGIGWDESPEQPWLFVRRTHA